MNENSGGGTLIQTRSIFDDVTILINIDKAGFILLVLNLFVP
jgi:hypothetical protein